MTRLLLTWIGFTILQLGAPRSTSAAELRAGGESTRIVPRLEVLAHDVLAREGARLAEHRGTHTAPFASTEPVEVFLSQLRGDAKPQEPGRRGPLPLPSFLPEARAPPA